MTVPYRIALAGLLLATGQFLAQAPADDLPQAFEALGKETAAVVTAHRELYLGTKKTPEQASKLPAVLWHLGEPVTTGDEVCKAFESARDLGHDRNAARLEALAGRADALRPRAVDLRDKATAAANSARKLAARVASLSAADAAKLRLADATDTAPPESEPALLLALAAGALEGKAASPARAAACLEELAAQLGRLADLDRWLDLNCEWLRETAGWTKEPGMAPRSLCYSIEARFNEVAFLQSRAEDILFATEAERAAWPWAAARSIAGVKASAPEAKIGGAPVAEAERRIAELRKAEADVDRRVAALVHERKLREADPMRRKEYLPMIVELEYLQREVSIHNWTAEGRAGDLVVADRDARALSLTARAALARVAEALDEKDRRRLAPVLKDMLGREYLAAYADLCLYQSAVLVTEPGLATRLQRWLAITPRPDVAGLMEMLHTTPGCMTTAQRSDNAYQPQVMAWAAECRGKDREARFREARKLTNAFYRKVGYNQNKPVYSMRDILENGLVDCLAACRIHGAVAAAAGVTGIVPVRYWKERLGHTLIGIRTDKGILVVDPLGGDRTRPYPGGYPNVLTVETGAPSFGTYVVDDIEIVSTGKRLRRELPYLEAPAASRD